jgi:oxygen-independent coproporphyrinogen III oxidase
LTEIIEIPIIKFCEYVVLEREDAHQDDLYISLLLKEMDMYKEIIGDKKIVGLDVGGGTPTRLSVEYLKNITEKLKYTFNIGEEVMFSIETTPVIAAKDPTRIEALYEMGDRRFSMGIQSVSKRLLNELGREGTTSIYEKAVASLRAAGFERFNVDLMYGFLNQIDEDLENTLNYGMGLKPENITLYRNRCKGTKIEEEAPGVSLYKIIGQYRLACQALTGKGYAANEGKNTFSRVDGDFGTSGYLTQRVVYGEPYLGLGLGAQSLGKDYLSYNSGAASKKLKSYRERIEACCFPPQDIYALDEDEIISKVLSVAFYFGFIDFKAFKNRFGINFRERFEGECRYLVDEGLMEMRDQAIYLTKRGADCINGVIPFFYSKRSRKELTELFKKKSEPTAVSDNERDPRGWIVSHPFVGLTDEGESSLRFGEDGIGEGASKVSLSYLEGIVKLTLRPKDISLCATVAVKTIKSLLGRHKEYTLLESEGIAFDHGRMIVSALDRAGLIQNL